jgi:Lon protease-like protein
MPGRSPRRAYSDEELEAAVDALAQAERFREAESVVAQAAPRLQRVLAEALAAGGWFGESHEAEVLKAATVPDEDERLTAVRTLLAEEARMGMMVGVAVGWALAEELSGSGESDTGDEEG